MAYPDAQALDSLRALASGPSRVNAADPSGLIQQRIRREDLLQEMKRNIDLARSAPQSFQTGATPADVTDLQSTLNEDPNMGLAAQKQVADTQSTNQDVATYNRPDVTTIRQGKESDALKRLLLPVQAQGQNAIDLEHAKTAGALQEQNAISKANAEFWKTQGGGGEGGGTGTPGVTPGTMKPAVDAKGRMSFSMVPTPPQQLSQEHGAQVGLSQIPTMRAMVADLGKSNDLGMVHGRMASALVSSGLDSILMSPGESEKFSQFKNQLSLMKSNMAMVHGGARGGSNVGMAQRFDQLANVNQSPAALTGAINTFERWLTQYAGAKSTAERDAADAEFGVGPGSSFGRTGEAAGAPGGDMTDPNRGMR